MRYPANKYGIKEQSLEYSLADTVHLRSRPRIGISVHLQPRKFSDPLQVILFCSGIIIIYDHVPSACPSVRSFLVTNLDLEPTLVCQVEQTDKTKARANIIQLFLGILRPQTRNHTCKFVRLGWVCQLAFGLGRGGCILILQPRVGSA
jgi:hypothetical protein